MPVIDFMIKNMKISNRNITANGERIISIDNREYRVHIYTCSECNLDFNMNIPMNPEEGDRIRCENTRCSLYFIWEIDTWRRRT